MWSATDRHQICETAAKLRLRRQGAGLTPTAARAAAKDQQLCGLERRPERVVLHRYYYTCGQRYDRAGNLLSTSNSIVNADKRQLNNQQLKLGYKPHSYPGYPRVCMS